MKRNHTSRSIVPGTVTCTPAAPAFFDSGRLTGSGVVPVDEYQNQFVYSLCGFPEQGKKGPGHARSRREWLACRCGPDLWHSR